MADFSEKSTTELVDLAKKSSEIFVLLDIELTRIQCGARGGED